MASITTSADGEGATASLPTDRPAESVTREETAYGRLWPDGTFNHITWSCSERAARKQFAEKAYDLKHVPESLRPVFARQRVVTTIDTYSAEAVPEAQA